MTEGQIPPPESTPPIDSGVTKSAAYQGPAPDKDAMTMGMLCHLLALPIGFLGPLLIWLLKKDQSPFVDDQGKEALNFQITIAIGFIICGLLTCVFIGVFIMPVVALYHIIFCIIAALKAKEGIAYRYPFALRLVK
jgi:uncharacterized Tic20 family protein